MMIFLPRQFPIRLGLGWCLRALLSAVACVVLVACGDKQNSKIDDLTINGYAFSVADFHRAAAVGDVVALEAFLEAGMAVDAPDATGGTALLGAALSGEAGAVAFLIDNGADGESLAGSDGRNLLMMTAEIGADDVVQVLLAREVCDPTERDKDGYHALGLATVGGQGEVVDLLARRASRDMLDDALLFSAVLGDVKTADMLLARGASVLARDANGRTPLMHAARRGHLEMVRLLMDNGANRYAVEPESGKTAGSYAAEVHQAAADEKVAQSRLEDLRVLDGLLNHVPYAVGQEVAGTLVDHREVITVGEDGHLPYEETPELYDHVRVGERLDGAVINSGGGLAVAVTDASLPEGVEQSTAVDATETQVALSDELKMIEYREKPMPILVTGVSPGKEVSVRLLYGSGREVTAQKGDCIDRLPLVVEEVRRKMGHSKEINDGDLGDISVVTFRNVESGELYEMTTGLEGTAGESYAVIERESGALFKVMRGDVFGASPDAPMRYEVIDIQPNRVLVEDTESAEVIVLEREKR